VTGTWSVEAVTVSDWRRERLPFEAVDEQVHGHALLRPVSAAARSAAWAPARVLRGLVVVAAGRREVRRFGEVALESLLCCRPDGRRERRTDCERVAPADVEEQELMQKLPETTTGPAR
jgi:hypothetical protein